MKDEETITILKSEMSYGDIKMRLSMLTSVEYFSVDVSLYNGNRAIGVTNNIQQLVTDAV
jgi:hypothetical protein